MASDSKAHMLNGSAVGKGALEASCNNPERLMFLNTGKARRTSSLIAEN